jgi:RimJ/RimL family protein N-acetyltransferase
MHQSQCSIALGKSCSLKTSLFLCDTRFKAQFECIPASLSVEKWTTGDGLQTSQHLPCPYPANRESGWYAGPVTPPKPAALHWTSTPPPGPVTLRGRHVTLEPLNADQHGAALWEAVRGHDELWTWLADGPYATSNHLLQAIKEKQASTFAVFLAIVPAATGRAAGFASYMRMEPAHGVVEVGNILLSPSLQRTTAATEAMYLMAGHIFEHLGYRRYEWKCNAENLPSRRAALRLGFTFEGIFRQHMVVKDLNRDTAWFSMLDSEWPARKQAFETWLAPANFLGNGRQRQSLSHLMAAGH